MKKSLKTNVKLIPDDSVIELCQVINKKYCSINYVSYTIIWQNLAERVITLDPKLLITTSAQREDKLPILFKYYQDKKLFITKLMEKEDFNPSFLYSDAKKHFDRISFFNLLNILFFCYKKENNEEKVIQILNILVKLINFVKQLKNVEYMNMDAIISTTEKLITENEIPISVNDI
jgi:virulence-associated protein VapD